jgi:hypothetical protein
VFGQPRLQSGSSGISPGAPDREARPRGAKFLSGPLEPRARSTPLGQLLRRLNPVLRGWCAYFRSGVSSRTFNYLRAYTWQRVVGWLRRKHRRANWRWLKRRYLPRWWPTDGATTLFNPGGVRTTRYRYRGKSIPTPWQEGALAVSEPALALERLEGLVAR